MKHLMETSLIQTHIKDSGPGAVKLPASGRGYTWRLTQPKQNAPTSPNTAMDSNTSGEKHCQKIASSSRQ